MAGMLAALLALPALAALLLRRTGAPGAAVLAGLAVGVLLGPTIFGRVWPDTYQQLVIGGVTERQALRSIVRQIEALTIAVNTTEHDQAALRDELARLAGQRAPAQSALERAVIEHQRPMRMFVAVLVGSVMLSAAVARHRAASASDGPHPGAGTSVRPSAMAAASIGLGAALVPGGLACVAAVSWGDSWPAALLIAAAMAIGPWALALADRRAADLAELGGAPLIELAGRCSSLIALIILAAALAPSGPAALGWIIPAAMLTLSWVVPMRTLHRSTTTASIVTWIDHAARWVLLPALAAATAMKIELFEHAAFWPLVVLALLSGDGRWLGALLGALLPGGRGGSRTLRTMRLVIGSVAAGPTQLAVAAVAVTCGALPETAAYGLLLGVVMIEVTTPLRAGMADRFIRTEQDIQAIEER